MTLIEEIIIGLFGFLIGLILLMLKKLANSVKVRLDDTVTRAEFKQHIKSKELIDDAIRARIDLQLTEIDKAINRVEVEVKYSIKDLQSDIKELLRRGDR